MKCIGVTDSSVTLTYRNRYPGQVDFGISQIAPEFDINTEIDTASPVTV